MRRILIVARTEFLALVRTKAFIIGILMAPAMIGLSVGFQVFAGRQSDRESHRFAVVDDTGVLFSALEQAALEHNLKSGAADARTGPHFLPERATTHPGDPEQRRAALSERVRSKDLFAFVELPVTMLDGTETDADQLRYYTETPSYTPLPDWIRQTVEREAIARRLAAASVDAAVVGRLTRRASITTLGLVTRGVDGAVVDARRVNPLETFVLPFAMMYLLFMAVMSAAPPLLMAVVEEKMSRISEVLVAAIPPMHLMAGKLLGVAAVSALLALLYVGGGVYALVTAGQADLVSARLVGWFVVFLLLAVLMYGAVFIAIGAACSDIKDSQSMMQPAILFLMVPLLAAPVVIRAPHATLSVVLSLVPTATPFLMLMRLAMTPPPPLWQVVLGIVLTATTAAACVFVAGRIFRIGLLMQGKPPNLPELLRWIRQ
jgi:ABC-2 type transport system permease protein